MRGVRIFLLLDRPFHPSEQVGAVFETEHHDAVEASVDGIHVGYFVAVGLGVVDGIGRRVYHFAPGFLRRKLCGQRACKSQKKN